MASERTVAPTRLKPDWVVVALPTVLAFQVFNFKLPFVVVGLMTGYIFLRKSECKFHLEPGPILFLFASCWIVYSRPESWRKPALLILLMILVMRLLMTVDARRIIASLIDGLGLYLVVNVLAHLAGMRAPHLASQRFDRVAEGTGFMRTVFPMTNSINSPSIIATIYLVSSILVLRYASWTRRGIWFLSAAAAMYAMISAGSRAALAFTAILSIGALFFPIFSRWIAQFASVLAAISALVLPNLIKPIIAVIAPLVALNSGRDVNESDIISLQGRDQIWNGSIGYWHERINDFSEILIGFGSGGQYRSGASSTYASLVVGLMRNPQQAYVHNSFLQQLFDGGVIGFLLLVIGVYWASARLARRRYVWAPWGLSAVFAMTALLLGNMTEATMAPGVFQESFWVLLVLVGVACQTPADDNGALRQTCPPEQSQRASRLGATSTKFHELQREPSGALPTDGWAGRP